MEVTLRVRNINVSKDYDKLEFVYKETRMNVKDIVSFTIMTLHDFLFEKVALRLKQSGTFREQYVGVVYIQNSTFSVNKSNLITKKVLSSNYVHKTDFYDLNGLKTIGNVSYDYIIKINENRENQEVENDNFVQKIFDLFLDQQKSVLLVNFMSVIDDFLVGSRSCNINFLLGLIFLEKYTAILYHKLTKNLEMDDLRNLKMLKICKTRSLNLFNFHNTENAFLLEKVLFGEQWRYEYVSILEGSNNIEENIRKAEIDNLEINQPVIEQLIEKEKVHVKIFQLFNRILHNKKTAENVLILLENAMDVLSKSNENVFSTNESSEHLFTEPEKNFAIHEILSNDGYVIANKNLLVRIINCLYFAVGAYGNSWATIFCKKKKKINNILNIESNRKAILEFLDIDDKDLLSINMASENVPQHIIFFDKNAKRIVVSFKGTSTSDEALKDLNCRYVKFYEGYAHKGITNMACEFVKNKTKEILMYAEQYKTKNVLITGHSLGASIGIMVHFIYCRQDLLGLLDLTTIVFAAAPVLSYNLAMLPIKNLLIINYGNDFVSRVSYGSVLEMKYTSCSLGNHYGILKRENDIEKDLLIIKKHLKGSKKFLKLYCPGSNYHFKRLYVKTQNKNISLIVYKKVDLHFFNSIIVIKHATIHHLLPHLLDVFEQGIVDLDAINKN